MSRVSVRGTWLCLTLVRSMARLTSGVILPVRPGPPSPSPETAGLLDREVGGSRRAADAGSLSETGASGPPPGGQINPLPFRAEDTHGMKYVQSDQENRSIISQTGACPTPHPPVTLMRWPVAGHTAVSGGRGMVTAFPGLPTGRPSQTLPGWSEKGWQVPQGLPCGGSADAKPTMHWRRRGSSSWSCWSERMQLPLMFQARVPLKATSHSPAGVAPLATPGLQEVPELPAHPPVRPRSESSPATPQGPHLVLVTTAGRPSPQGVSQPGATKRRRQESERKPVCGQ